MSRPLINPGDPCQGPGNRSIRHNNSAARRMHGRQSDGTGHHPYASRLANPSDWAAYNSVCVVGEMRATFRLSHTDVLVVVIAVIDARSADGHRNTTDPAQQTYPRIGCIGELRCASHSRSVCGLMCKCVPPPSPPSSRYAASPITPQRERSSFHDPPLPTGSTLD
ncbi:uncharacterized protein BO95DRAFT_198896 [Aspergillus brunneoviolaceus CBS 621.78]|uniref:Uncharacterized protein n=1 Tax=Aspergillus brunneoviolaceus CBS 621.78 TaxID=1450534 RepID=A0ACD1GM24_9EURO|nr:hypothetical protein BO95DRAFT_198896 [Aspergillus brunneoviolaceus CBS 621.78]RAH50399.1 hypothetical protein BO95DRAFT_198896 [Aspergillus brunneoviolaceus CBS 621.78]